MWNEKKYQNLIKEIYLYQDKTYLEFNKKNVNTPIPMIGVCIPILRDIAKKISKTDIDSFISCYQGNYYEERVIYGLVIAYSNKIEVIDKYLISFSTEIKDWATCDVVANSLKLIDKNQDYFYHYIEYLINTNNEFQVRFGLALLLSHYINDNYIDKIIKIVMNIKSDKYYINMMCAWLLCEIYIKYPSVVDPYINKKYLDKFVLNKTISKICDSYRINSEIKKALKQRRF